MKNKKSLKNQINAAIAAGKNTRPFAVFDFDNTCIANDIAEATLNHMARHALFNDPTIVPGPEQNEPQALAKTIFQHYYRLLEAGNVLGAYEFGAKTLSGLNVLEIEALIRDVIESEGVMIGRSELFGAKIAKGLATRPAVIGLISDLQKQGVEIWIVSASPRLLVAEAMKHFGIMANLIGVRHVIKDGSITSELEYPLSVMGGKVDCIKLFIDPTVRPLIGVGDSGNDLPMLEYSIIKAVVNRGNSLSKKAEDERWPFVC